MKGEQLSDLWFAEAQDILVDTEQVVSPNTTTAFLRLGLLLIQEMTQTRIAIQQVTDKLGQLCAVIEEKGETEP